MERYAVHRLGNLTRDDDAARIEAYLNANGIATSGVVVRWDEQDGAQVIVTAASDPTAALSQYTTTPTDAEDRRAQAIADAKPVIQAIAAKPRADRTPVERALLGISLAVRELSEPQE